MDESIEYMWYEGEQYIKKNGRWYFNGVQVGLDAEAELEMEYLRQFKST